MTPLNHYQHTVISAYCNGEFAYLLTSTNWKTDLRSCGDTLLAAVLTELFTDEDCGNIQGAVSRMKGYLTDISVCLVAFKAAPIDGIKKTL